MREKIINYLITFVLIAILILITKNIVWKI